MKKIKLLFASIAVLMGLVSVSCNKAALKSQDSGDFFPEYLNVIFAKDITPDTKVIFDENDLSFAWENDDYISANGATYKRNNNKECFQYYNGGFTSAPGSDIIGVYPVELYAGGTSTGSLKYSLPYSYLWKTETRKVDYIPQAGVADNSMNMVFRNLTALFKVNLKNTSRNTVWVKSITLTSDKTMSGDFSMSFTNGIPTLSFVESGTVYPGVKLEMDNVVELPSNTSYVVYIPVPAQSYTAFNVKVMAYSQVGEQLSDIVFYNSTATTTPGTSESVSSLTCERAKMYSLNISANNFRSGVLGDGSSNNPYQIGTLQDLLYIQNMISSSSAAAVNHFVKSYYILTADLTLTQPWTSFISGGAVAGSQSGFSGVFDGNGHTIDASGFTNTASIFWDLKDGVIKNLILKGNFNLACGGNPATLSPFCASGLGNCVMISVIFEGEVIGGTSTSLFALGAYRGDCYIVGSYVKAKMKDTPTGWRVGTHQIYGCASPGYSGKLGATPYGVVGDMTTVSAPETTKTYHSSNGSIVEVAAMTVEQKVDEMEGAVVQWNEDLKYKLQTSQITQDDYNRKSAKKMVSHNENGYILVDVTL